MFTVEQIILLREIKRMKDENEEFNRLFKLQHKRTIEADRLWREAHPERGDVLPDLGELIGWLLEERNKLKNEIAKLKERN